MPTTTTQRSAEVTAPWFRGVLLLFAGVPMGASFAYVLFALLGIDPMAKSGWFFSLMFGGGGWIIGWVAMRDQPKRGEYADAAHRRRSAIAPTLFVIGIVAGIALALTDERERFERSKTAFAEPCRALLGANADADRVTACSRIAYHCDRVQFIGAENHGSYSTPPPTEMPMACAARELGLSE